MRLDHAEHGPGVGRFGELLGGLQEDVHGFCGALGFVQLRAAVQQHQQAPPGHRGLQRCCTFKVSGGFHAAAQRTKRLPQVHMHLRRVWRLGQRRLELRHGFRVAALCGLSAAQRGPQRSVFAAALQGGLGHHLGAAWVATGQQLVGPGEGLAG